MSELKLTIDIFAPETSKTLTISGKHPSRLLSITPKLLSDTFKIDPSNVYEDELRWDASEDDKVYFWGNWRARVVKDARTVVWFNIKVQGEQNVKDRFGSVIIKLKPVITSTWKFSTPIDRALGYYYLTNIYADRRRKYMEDTKIDVSNLENYLRRLLETVEKEHRGI